MNKDYIFDNGKIRNCTSNIAKMNVLEYVFFDVKNGFFKYALQDIIEQFLEGFKGLMLLLCAIFNVMLVVFFPVTLWIRAILAIKNARKEIEKYNFK